MAFTCASCGKRCATKTGLDDHTRAKQHHYCEICDRSFVSESALGQHRESSAAHAQALTKTAPPSHPPPAVTMPPKQNGPPPLAAELLIQPVAMTTFVPAALLLPPPLTHRGNTYTGLTPLDQSIIYLQLLQQCHPLSRLALEDYPVTRTAVTPTRTPRPDPARPKRKAVVLDCEMVGSRPGRPEQVISVSAVCFLTGETLVDALVEPAEQVRGWRSKVHGITRATVAAAVASGRALLGGRQAAAAALLEHVDENTVLVGHALRGDLRALGLAHARVVDSAILTAEAAPVPVDAETGGKGGRKLGGRTVGLEKLCRELVGLQIRRGGNGGGGAGQEPTYHESLEDVLATREVMIWCLRYPGELREWAARHWAPKATASLKARTAAKTQEKGGRRRNDQATARAERAFNGHGALMDGDDDDDDDDEDDNDDDDSDILLWEDVVDYDLWPKSPPDWSD